MGSRWDDPIFYYSPKEQTNENFGTQADQVFHNAFAYGMADHELIDLKEGKDGIWRMPKTKKEK